MRLHVTCAREKHSYEIGMCDQECALHACALNKSNVRVQMKLKLMLRPFCLSVPSSKISLISCFFRRVLSPLQRLRPQIMMSLSEWEAELKCSATGKPGQLFRELRRRLPKRSRSRLPVSPMYKQPQRRHMME